MEKPVSLDLFKYSYFLFLDNYEAVPVTPIQEISSSVNSSPAPSLDPCLQKQLLFFDVISGSILEDISESSEMLLQDNVTQIDAYHNIEPDTIIDNGKNNISINKKKTSICM